MKANRETDELLCSFIDGELPLRQQTEVQRLVARDAEVAQRLVQLQNCKNLVTALPRAEAPGEMLEQIRVSLERRTLLEDRPMSSASRAGARHLKIRRFVAAAAMVALVGGLAAVVYQILAPVSPPGPGVFVATAPDPKVNVTVAPVAGFSGRLELHTAAFAQADAFVKTAIEDNGLSDFSESQMQGGARIYRVDCSREGVNRLVADLGTIWQEFQSATLSVETDRFADPVVIEAVTLQQTARIISQNSADAAVALAGDVAVLNRFAREMPGREVLSTTDDTLSPTVPLPRIPRPVLASDDPAMKKIMTPPEGKVKASLIIVLLNTQ